MVKGSGAKHNDNDDRRACFSSGFAHTVGPLGFYMSRSEGLEKVKDNPQY